MKYLLTLFLSISAFAGNKEILNLNNIEYHINPKLNAIFYIRARTNTDIGHYYQTKYGGILEYIDNKTTYFVGHYKVLEWNSFENEYGRTHRNFIGVRHKINNYEARYVLESFHLPSNKQFYRNRYRITYEKKVGKLIPSASYEYLRFRDKNFNRFNFTVSKQFNKHFRFGVGWEERQQNDGSYNHILMTNVRYTIK